MKEYMLMGGRNVEEHEVKLGSGERNRVECRVASVKWEQRISMS